MQGYGTNTYHRTFTRSVHIKKLNSKNYEKMDGKDFYGEYILHYDAQQENEEKLKLHCTALCDATPDCGGIIFNKNWRECWVKDKGSMQGGPNKDDGSRFISYKVLY